MVDLTGLARHTVRRLVRAPAFVFATMFTLALGIGGTIAVFSVVDAVLIRPLPYPRSDQLVDLSHSLAVAGVARVDQSDATYLVYARDNRVFSDVGAYRSTAVNLEAGASTSVATVAGSSVGNAGATNATERVSAAAMSASVLHALQIPPRAGRGLTPDDDVPGAPPVVVISAGLWRRDFGSDRAIVGRRVRIDGIVREIVGVMPDGFAFPTPATALWMPLGLDPTRTKSAAFDYRGIARLRPGVTLAAAASDLQRLLPQVPVVFPGRLTSAAITVTHMQAVVRPLRDVVIGDVGRVLWIVLGAVVAVFLVACANVASLFLARAEGRQRELAVRRALGAGNGDVAAEFLSEAIVLSLAGGALGLAGAWAGLHLLVSATSGATIPRLGEARIDATVGAISVLLSAFTALIVSVIPLARGRAVSLSAVLAAHGPSGTGGAVRQRTRRVLVVAQIALALMLLASAGLLARSFAHLRAVDPGFDTRHTLSFRLAVPASTYASANDVAKLAARTIDALRALPGVDAAALTTKLPFDDEARQDSAVFVRDRPIPAGEMPGIHGMAFVTPDYFRAMGIPMRAGATFGGMDGLALDDGDSLHREPEVIVSDVLANKYWGTVNVVGRQLRLNPAGPWSTVVGVVEAVRDDGLDRPAAATVYSPLVTRTVSGAPWAPRDLAFVVRTSGDPARLAAAVRTAVASAAPSLPMFRMTLLRDLESDSAARMTFTLFLLAVAGVVTTLVGAAGIYGVISYLVGLRRREIGVRIALGASAASVRGLVLRHALTDAAAGIGLGLIGVTLVARSLGALLFGVGALDPATLAGAAIVLAAVSAVASWVPARRASAVDPVIVLRAE